MNQIIIFCANGLIFISALYAFVHIILKHERRHHVRHIALIFGSAVLAWVVAHLLKNIIAHPRPDLTGALIAPDSLYSFPSGHATFMFALAWSLYGFDKRAGAIIFTLAGITGIARVLSGVHFWYDIVAGFVVGGCVAYVVFLLTKRIRS
ncbi:MAG: phosphatase PAP2 family protein [Candidatus Paceibacterota bacterium]